jgi:sugar phosphate isomerase/epimerase
MRPGKKRNTFPEMIDFFSRIGFEAVDVNFSASIYREEDRIETILHKKGWEKGIEEVKMLADKKNLHIYMGHLPFFEYGNEDDPERKFRFEMTGRSLEACAMMGIKWAVVHPSNLQNYESAKKATNNYLDKVQKKANDLGVGIAIENMPKPQGFFSTDINALCRLNDERGPGLGCCYDTGHAHVARIPMYESIIALGKRIKTLHVHDNFGQQDNHIPAFMGTIDWTALTKGLVDAGYEGDFNFEVNPLKTIDPTEAMREAHARYILESGRKLLSMMNKTTD